MKKIIITLDDYLYTFYRKIGENAGGIKPEKVLEDVLFRVAGELSQNAWRKKNDIPDGDAEQKS